MMNLDDAAERLDALVEERMTYGETVLARRFAQRHRNDFRFVPQWSAWLAWDGTRWARDELGAANLAAQRLCDEIAATARTDVLFGEKPERRERAALIFQSRRSVEAVLKLAQVQPAIAADVGALDANEWLLNTPQGTFDLLTGQMREQRRDDLITKCTTVSPGDIGAGKLLFDKFMADITCGDVALADYLQRALGACLSGARADHWLMFWYGAGRNGKNTLGDVVLDLLGDYGRVVPTQTLMADQHGSRHPTEIANLRGLRLAVSSEVAEGEHWHEQRVKELTGDMRLSGRFMRGDFFEFSRTHKHIVYGNHRPMLRIVDPAIAERLHIVPFNAEFTTVRGNLDTEMPEKLRRLAPGILAWLIDGHSKWRKDGVLRRCNAVADATGDYLASQATLDMWLTERCVLIPDDGRGARGWTQAKTLYDDFAAWKRERNEGVPSSTRWGEQMSRRFRKVLAGGARYVGLGLLKRHETGERPGWRPPMWGRE